MKKRCAKPDKNGYKYSFAAGLSKILRVVFGIINTVIPIVIILSLIIAAIVFFVKLPAEEMLLPPIMSRGNDGFYSISLGNGILIRVADGDVSANDIKTVIYAELIDLVVLLCTVFPASVFLRRIASSTASGAPFNINNARYIIMTGIVIAAGYTVRMAERRFYNYLLVKTFAPNPQSVEFLPGIGIAGIIFGAIIIFIGLIFGHASERYVSETVTTEVNTSVETSEGENN